MQYTYRFLTDLSFKACQHQQYRYTVPQKLIDIAIGLLQVTCKDCKEGMSTCWSRLARNASGYMIKKVYVCHWQMVAVYHATYILSLCSTQIQFVLYSLQVQCSLNFASISPHNAASICLVALAISSISGLFDLYMEQNYVSYITS